VVVSILAIILAYPLSMGPAVRLAHEGIISWETFRMVYAPIFPSRGVLFPGEVMRAYCQFWEPNVYFDSPHRGEIMLSP
jgi:hypothetical protein